MVVEAVCRIVGRAESADAELVKDSEHPQLVGRETGVGKFPDLRGVGRIKQTVESKVPLQFQVAPVVERIAQRVGHRAGPR